MVYNKIAYSHPVALSSSFANLINKINCIYIYIFILFTEKHITDLLKTISAVDRNFAYLKISTPRPLDHEQDIKLNYINFQAK